MGGGRVRTLHSRLRSRNWLLKAGIQVCGLGASHKADEAAAGADEL